MIVFSPTNDARAKGPRVMTEFPYSTPGVAICQNFEAVLKTNFYTCVFVRKLCIWVYVVYEHAYKTVYLQVKTEVLVFCYYAYSR